MEITSNLIFVATVVLFALITLLVSIMTVIWKISCADQPSIRAAVGQLFFDHIGTVRDVFQVDFLLQLRQLRGSRCAFMSASIRK